MRPLGLSGLLLCLFLASACEQPKTIALMEKPQAEKSPVLLVGLPSFTALAKKEGPAVVNISSTKTVSIENHFGALPGLPPNHPLLDFFRHFGLRDAPENFRTKSLGSGFILDQDGHILTNAHVVENADEVKVILLDKREFTAKVIGADRRSDVALIKISAKNLPFVTIGDPDQLEVGEWVVAIGTPFGFTNSLTQGIVSAKGRALPGESTPFIQTDAAINPGNSGGPLFNLKGEVVGVNSQIYSQSGGYMGISFAIPIDMAIRIKDELVRHGKVKRGKLGVSLQNISPELAEAYGLPKVAGTLISSIENGGPADKAGMQAGDVVVQADGKAVDDTTDLVRKIGETPPGTSVRLGVWRDGKIHEIVATLGEANVDEAPEKPTRKALPDRLGLAARELSPTERQARGTDGHVVVVTATGLAESAGIQPGDVILSINNKPIASLEQMNREVEKSTRHIGLLALRGKNTRIYFSISLRE